MRELVTIDEIKQRYPNEWVCIEVVKEGKNGRSIAGYLITHSPDKRKVLEAAKTFRASNPHARGSLLFTGELIPQELVVILATSQ